MIAAWSALSIDVDKLFDDMVQLIAINFGYSRKLTFQHTLVEAIHVLSPEWGDKGADLVTDTPKRPNIRFGIVWKVFPDLWRSVIWGTGLCIEHALFGHFRDIEVAELGYFVSVVKVSVKDIGLILWVFVQEHVGRLQIPMENVHGVKLLKATDHRDHDLPNLGLLDISFVLLMGSYLLVEVAIVCELHHDA